MILYKLCSISLSSFAVQCSHDGIEDSMSATWSVWAWPEDDEEEEEGYVRFTTDFTIDRNYLAPANIVDIDTRGYRVCFFELEEMYSILSSYSLSRYLFSTEQPTWRGHTSA